MAVTLVLDVSRAEGSRLSGTVRLADDANRRRFSGTLELMRVFEELVPEMGPDADGDPTWTRGPDDKSQEGRT